MSEIQLPYLPEHASSDGRIGEGSGHNPSPEERKVLQLVDSLYGKAKKYRKKYDQKWIDFYKFFRGKQWKEVRPSYRHSEVLNVVFQTIQSMVPTLTDSRPTLEFLPTIPSQYELADILTKVAENDWVHNNWMMVLTEILFDSHIYGTGFGHCGYDDDANQGLGNICFESQDPFYFFPDPQARDINGRRTKHIIIAEPIDISVLKKEYPDKAAHISADVLDMSQGDKSDIDQTLFRSPVDSRMLVEGGAGLDAAANNQALKITVYLKDEDVEEVEKIEPCVGGMPESTTEQRLKYPNGRKIVVAGGVVLEDGPMEYEDGLFPFARMINYVLPREFWGMGDVDQLEGPQKTLNKLVSFTLDVITLMGNPIWVVGNTANIDTDNLFNKPGLIVETDDPNAVRREPGVDLQPFILSLMDRYRTYMDGISGETDLSRGAEPTDVTAASAIDSLQQAQQTRLRLKSRNIDAFLQEFGKLYLSRVFQYYSVPRIVRVSGNNNAQEYFYFHVEKLEQPDGSVQQVANITSPEGEVRTMQITSDFDVRVSTGSSLPFAKKEKVGIAMNLFKLGVIDDEELMKAIDYPNYQQVLSRVNEKKQQMAAQQSDQQNQQMQMQAQLKAQGSSQIGPPQQ